MKDWAAVVDAGAVLPGVDHGTSYGKSALKFRGKMLAATTAPDCPAPPFRRLTLSHRNDEVTAAR